MASILEKPSSADSVFGLGYTANSTTDDQATDAVFAELEETAIAHEQATDTAFAEMYVETIDAAFAEYDFIPTERVRPPTRHDFYFPSSTSKAEAVDAVMNTYALFDNQSDNAIRGPELLEQR